MRATRLAVLTATAALLGACASSGIRSEGGDVFMLETNSLSGSRAVERGLADARDFCTANGRQLVVQDSRIGSGNYQLQFRCVAPFGTARAGGVDPLMAAAATPVVTDAPPPTRRRARRASTAPATDAVVVAPAADPAETPRPARRSRRTRPADAAYVPTTDNSGLQPIPQSTLPARFAREETGPQEPPPLPPVSTTPLFNPRGASFPAPVPVAARRLPADNGPFTPIEAPSMATAAAAPVAAQPVAAQPVTLVQPAAPRAPAGDLPPIQLPPAAVSSPSAAAPLAAAAPAASYGASVPSPQALPSASSALTPIASPLRPIPAATPTPSPASPPTGFFSSPGR